MVSRAHGAEPTVSARTEDHVRKELLEPLAQREAGMSRFSRGRRPPSERRVRAQPTALTDAAGKSFVPFVVDSRMSLRGAWNEGELVGCAYAATGEIFVLFGKTFYSSAALFGRDVEPVPGVCEPRRPS